MKVSICCLIYKSLPWLEFVYRQLQAYTDLAGREFFFVANDATPEVLASLRQRAIPHYIHHNSTGLTIAAPPKLRGIFWYSSTPIWPSPPTG
jgi:hypothetical protein